jgi:cell division protein ZapE
MIEGPLPLYRARVRDGSLTPDTDQELAAEKLQGLCHALTGYRPGAGGGWRERLGLARRTQPAPQGLYLCGGVGRGKSMLMDLFFDTAPVERKRRVHFHAFMLEVHERLHALRATAADDALPQLARALAEEAWLLCFDEFHVTDIADAMILGRLFGGLFNAGVVVVATSNWPPDDLYKDGLQRPLFLPFIDVLKARLDVLVLAGPVDYRLGRLSGDALYHWPLDASAERAMDRVFAELTGGAVAEPVAVPVAGGRTLTVPRAAKTVARLSFEELCARPLGAADYIALARRFDTVMIDGVPLLTEDKRNEAKRFMTLIDELYEHRVKLALSADAAAERLHTGTTHAFEFARAVSRLMEMRSADYLRLPRLA